MADYNNRVDDLVIIPTLKCDLECRHCCRCSGPNRTEVMGEDVLSAIRCELPDRVPELTISGGEPFLDQDLLLNVIRSLPETSMLYVATNGLWTKSHAQKYKFFNETLPALKGISEGYGEQFSIDLSRDQYHREQEDVYRYWRGLLEDVELGFILDEDFEFDEEEPAEDDFEDYDEYMDAYEAWDEARTEASDLYCVATDAQDVMFTERPTQQDKILPIGRGKSCAFYRSDSKEDCGFDGDDRIRNQLTIWPDGRVSACCDGGAWVGNIVHQSLPEILRQRRAFLFWLRRRVGTYLNGGSEVPTDTCYDCRKFGKEFFGHKFKEAEYVADGRA